MKMRVGHAEVEGTPAELAELLGLMNPAAAEPSEFADPPTPGRKFVSEDVAFRALKRRSLSDEQRAVLTLLKDQSPRWVTAHELQHVTRYKPSQLAGLLGAFGKRVASTEGFREGTWFFDQEWDYENDCNRYRLPASGLAAVNRALQ